MTKNIENQKGNFIMLEKDNVRYEFHTEPLYQSNVDRTIIEYRPAYTRIENLILGSTMHTERFCGLTHEERVNKGNEFYKKLLAKGFKRVSERSFA